MPDFSEIGPKELGDLTSIFTDMFGAKRAPRVLPLVLAPGYRDGGEVTRSVRFRRRVRCAPCAGQGCSRCERVGWTVATESIEVRVPKGASLGVRLRLAGMGDELMGEDLDVELVEEAGARAVELAQAAAAHERAIAETWRKIRDERRRAWIRAIATVVVLALFLAALITMSAMRRAHGGM